MHVCLSMSSRTISGFESRSGSWFSRSASTFSRVAARCCGNIFLGRLSGQRKGLQAAPAPAPPPPPPPPPPAAEPTTANNRFDTSTQATADQSISRSKPKVPHKPKPFAQAQGSQVRAKLGQRRRGQLRHSWSFVAAPFSCVLRALLSNSTFGAEGTPCRGAGFQLVREGPGHHVQPATERAGSADEVDQVLRAQVMHAAVLILAGTGSADISLMLAKDRA